jgi:hypothetical protein
MNVEINFLVNGVALKKFDENKVYMADQTTFEIEFFNKDERTVCPRIVMNGEKFKSMPVVYPGEKYILKDFMDIKRRFLFTVYKVEDKDEINEIIQKNGLIEIDLFYEKSFGQPTILFQMENNPTMIPKLKETGKIVKGETTNTKYKTVNIELDLINSDYVEFKILPISYMPKDLHCKKCDSDYKSVNYNYCPKCGEDFNSEPNKIKKQNWIERLFN